jgi:hypothetical protein
VFTLLGTALLCDRPSTSAWLVAHHVSRVVRRRIHRHAPGIVPDSWAG